MDNIAAFPNKLRYQHLLVAVFIILLAFGLRTILIAQRIAYDPDFYPSGGDDQTTYLRFASLALEGNWPAGPHYYHPAPSYFFAAIFALLGTKSLLHLSLVLALLDSLTTGLLIGAAWLISKRPIAGYVSGLLYAFFPAGMLYATTPLTEPLAVFLLALFAFLLFWQGEKLSFWRTILLGFVAAGIALSRLNLLPIIALYILWLWQFGWRKLLLHGAIFTFFTCLAIAPITYQNYQLSGGDFIPVATTGSLELYLANNRDSAGRNGRTPALEAIDLGYFEALLRDIQVAPEHFSGLLAYKFALFWSNVEAANNLSFEKSAALVPMLQIPFNFLLLAALGLLGLVGIWQKNPRAALILGLMLAWICLGYIISFAFGRIRFPAVIPLALMASGLLFIRDIKRLLLPAVFIAALFGLSYWLLRPLPRVPPERSYSALPADAIPLNVQFGEIILLGWRPMDAWPAAENAYALVNQAYTVELFWQLPAETEQQYQFYLSYTDEGTRYAGLDRPIGAVSFPDWTSDQWQAGSIIGEIVGIRLGDDVPQARSGQIRVGVWYWDTEGLIVPVPRDTGENDILLQRLAVFNPSRLPEIPDLPPSDLIFGELIALRGYHIPERAKSGETINISFHWEALNEITADYRIFLHLADESGEVIAQGDNNLVLPLFTSNWIPHYPLLGELPLTMPNEAGTYQLYAGLYNENGRLSVDAPDNRVLLETIVVEP